MGVYRNHYSHNKFSSIYPTQRQDALLATSSTVETHKVTTVSRPTSRPNASRCFIVCFPLLRMFRYACLDFVVD